MKGTIKITTSGVHDLSILVDMKGLSPMDKAVLMDALGKALELNETDRLTIGAIIAIGGFGTLSGKSPETMRVDLSLLNELKKKKEKDNETDAL